MNKIKKDLSPFFSIVIPTRDRSDLVKSLIWSVLQQSYRDLEIIVCDNSSNNLTQDVLNKFKDDRLINIRTGNLGMSENYNVGINSVSGKYLMCISDKGILKKGALSYLHKLIITKNYKCITWALDNFVYPGHFFKSPRVSESRTLESSYLLKFMLGSDYRSYDHAPMHCTSCVSMELVEAIQKKHKNLCQAQNPDYTMAAQILLSTNTIYNLKENLVILRNVSSKDGYGMGYSLARKTQESRAFLEEHADWIKDTNRFSDIPIKNCTFIVDLMLRDTYKVLEDNNINPDIYLSKKERLISYYFFTYEEIISRTALGVNMKQEFVIWVEALNKESLEIKYQVNKRKRTLWFVSLKAHFKYFFKKNVFTLYLLDKLRPIRYKNSGILYKNIEDCYNFNVVQDHIK